MPRQWLPRAGYASSSLIPPDYETLSNHFELHSKLLTPPETTADTATIPMCNCPSSAPPSSAALQQGAQTSRHWLNAYRCRAQHIESNPYAYVCMSMFNGGA